MKEELYVIMCDYYRFVSLGQHKDTTGGEVFIQAIRQCSSAKSNRKGGGWGD